MYVPHTDINQQMITESYNTEATQQQQNRTEHVNWLPEAAQFFGQ